MTQAALIPATVNDVLAQKPQRSRREPHPYLHLASAVPRGIRARWCQDCRRPILTGVDADWCAGTVTVDITPLGAMGEVAATIAGRPTYTLDGQPAQLTRRDGAVIKRQPAGNPRRRWHKYDVLVEHQCGNPIPATFAILTMLAPVKQIKESNDDECPF